MFITVCGGANMDTIALVEGSPKSFEGEYRIKEMRRECGGSGSNFACASSHFGTKIAFVGCVGDDTEARCIKRNLRDFGLDLSQLQKDRQKPTGKVFIFVAGGERIMLSCDGANASLSFKKVEKDFLSKSDIIHVSKTPLEFARGVSYFAKGKKIPLSFDPGRMASLGLKRLKPILLKTDFFFPDEREVLLLTGKNALEGTRRLSRIVNLCITKVGKRGCIVGIEGKIRHVKGFSVAPLDTTGAGDIFNASFLFWHIEGNDVFDSAKFANASAALSITKIGGMSCFSKESIERFMRRGRR